LIRQASFNKRWSRGRPSAPSGKPNETPTKRDWRAQPIHFTLQIIETADDLAFRYHTG